MRRFALFVLLALLTACSGAPSESQDLTAIEKTQNEPIIVLPDPIHTGEPTSTATFAPMDTPTGTTTPTVTLTPTKTLTPTVIFTPTITNTPTETSVPTTTLPAGYSCIPTDTERTVATVVEIIDGDTIKVEINGLVYKVRYIGMDTTTIENFGSQATNMNIELVKEPAVTLVKDVSETDKYDRLLRYVFVGDVFINYELIRLGFANPAAYPPDVACQDLFSSAEQEARENGRGFWAPTATSEPSIPPAIVPVVPVQTPSEGGGNNPAPTQPPQDSNCDPSYPSFCIPPPPPDLDCGDISHSNFPVTGSDPHRFDGDHNGYGCEN